MNNPYLDHVSKTLKEEFNVDVVEDILLVRKDRVILYGENNLSEDNILYVITGTLQLIGLAEASSIQLTDLLKRFEYNNAYADVAGKTDYYGYVYGELFSRRPQTSINFPNSSRTTTRLDYGFAICGGCKSGTISLFHHQCQ